MSNYIRNGAKVLFDYLVSLILFVIFIFIFLNIAKDRFNELLPIYCIIVFILSFNIIYSDMKHLALKEKKPQYQLKCYPVKGLLYGIIGFLPIALLEVISIFVIFRSQLTDHIKHVFINVLMGPLYFIIKLLEEKPLGYVLATLVIPLVAMIGYLSGFYGFEIKKIFQTTDTKHLAAKFTKSPWNPTNKTNVKHAARKKEATETKVKS